MPKKKNTQQKDRKRKLKRERAREYQVHFFSFFILILIKHFGGKNLQKSDKKALNIIMHANILDDHANKLISASN